MTGNIALTDREAEVYRCLDELKKISEKEFQTDMQNQSIFSKSYWLKKTAEAAEIAGWSKTEIASKLVDLTEKHGIKIGRAWIYEVLSPLGYSDSPVSGHESSSEDGKESPPSGHESSSIYAERNERLITYLQKDIEFKKTLINRLETEPFLEKIPQEEQDELFYIAEKSQLNTGQENDGRQDVSERKYFMMYLVSTTAVNEKATELYLKYIKEWKSLTGKQYHKLMSGITRMVHPLFDPKNRDEAIDVGFYGMQCKQFKCKSCHAHYSQPPQICKEIIRRKNPKTGQIYEHVCDGTEFTQCFSWRVGIEGEGQEFKVKCYACLAVFKPQTMRLPVSEKIVIDSSRVY